MSHQVGFYSQGGVEKACSPSSHLAARMRILCSARFRSCFFLPLADGRSEQATTLTHFFGLTGRPSAEGIDLACSELFRVGSREALLPRTAVRPSPSQSPSPSRWNTVDAAAIQRCSSSRTLTPLFRKTFATQRGIAATKVREQRIALPWQPRCTVR